MATVLDSTGPEFKCQLCYLASNLNKPLHFPKSHFPQMWNVKNNVLLYRLQCLKELLCVKGEVHWVMTGKASCVAEVWQTQATIWMTVTPTTASVTATADSGCWDWEGEEPAQVTQLARGGVGFASPVFSPAVACSLPSETRALNTPYGH